METLTHNYGDLKWRMVYTVTNARLAYQQIATNLCVDTTVY